MSLFDYRQSQTLAAIDPTFNALIMAAMRKADTKNATRLRAMFPAITTELNHRYHSPGGELPSDPPTEVVTNNEPAR